MLTFQYVPAGTPVFKDEVGHYDVHYPAEDSIVIGKPMVVRPSNQRKLGDKSKQLMLATHLVIEGPATIELGAPIYLWVIPGAVQIYEAPPMVPEGGGFAE